MLGRIIYEPSCNIGIICVWFLNYHHEYLNGMHQTLRLQLDTWVLYKLWAWLSLKIQYWDNVEQVFPMCYLHLPRKASCPYRVSSNHILNQKSKCRGISSEHSSFYFELTLLASNYAAFESLCVVSVTSRLHNSTLKHEGLWGTRLKFSSWYS